MATPSKQKISDLQMLRDNPFWPYGSSTQQAQDATAKLPQPLLIDNNSVWSLTEHDIDCVTIGSAILSSGGGGDFMDGRNRALQPLKQGKKVNMANPCRVDATKMGLICSVALMGDPSGQMEQGTTSAKLAFKRLQEMTVGGNNYKVTEEKCTDDDGPFSVYIGDTKDLDKIYTGDVDMSQKITALTAVETGGLNTMEPLFVSTIDGLPPCLDVAGSSRSYPELPMYLPFIYGLPCCPASLADDKGKSWDCVGAANSKQMGDYYRTTASNLDELLSLTIGPMKFEDIFTKMVVFATSQAWQLGRAVYRAVQDTNNLSLAICNAILAAQRGAVLISGTVAYVTYKSEDGFTKGYCDVQGSGMFDKLFVRVYARNENYIAYQVDSAGPDAKVGDMLGCIPDLLSLVNLQPPQNDPLQVPIISDNKYIKTGDNVAVLVLYANHLLYTSDALKVIGPRAYGIDMDYQPPTLLK